MIRGPTMISLVEDYLTHRRQLGFALRVEGQQLLAFARYADAEKRGGSLTVALALRWAQCFERAAATKTVYANSADACSAGGGQRGVAVA